MGGRGLLVCGALGAGLLVLRVSVTPFSRPSLVSFQKRNRHRGRAKSHCLASLGVATGPSREQPEKPTHRDCRQRKGMGRHAERTQAEPEGVGARSSPGLPRPSPRPSPRAFISPAHRGHTGRGPSTYPGLKGVDIEAAEQICHVALRWQDVPFNSLGRCCIEIDSPFFADHACCAMIILWPWAVRVIGTRCQGLWKGSHCHCVPALQPACSRGPGFVFWSCGRVT